MVASFIPIKKAADMTCSPEHIFLSPVLCTHSDGQSVYKKADSRKRLRGCLVYIFLYFLELQGTAGTPFNARWIRRLTTQITL